jgi:hypothetical protein
MLIRVNALAAAALLSFSGIEAARAQSQFPSASSQAMMSHQRMMNQMEMMNRSQQLQAMSRAREAQQAKQARAKCQSRRRAPRVTSARLLLASPRRRSKRSRLEAGPGCR